MASNETVGTCYEDAGLTTHLGEDLQALPRMTVVRNITGLVTYSRPYIFRVRFMESQLLFEEGG